MGSLHLIFVLAVGVALIHAAPDNRGTEFVVGYMANYVESNPVHLFVTTSRTTTVNVRVRAPRYTGITLDESFTVTAGMVHQLKISNKIRAAGTEFSNKGVHITADDEVVVYGTNIERYSNDAFLGFPVDVLGKEYYTVSHHPSTKECAFMVIGVEDGTSVSITLGVHSSIEVKYNNRYYHKNDVITQNMDKFDTLQILTYGDLTGSYIKATKKIAVMSGNRRTSVKPGGSRDHIVDQMLPVDVWGKKFAIVPTPERTTGDNIRFIGSEDGTSVSVTCSKGWSRTFTVNAGRHALHVTPSDQCCYVESSAAIMVILIVVSQVRSSEPADPALITIPPIEQYGADYTFATPKYSLGEYKNFFMFIVKESEKSGLKANGNAFPSNTVYTRVPNTDYVAGHVVLAPGTHTLRHDSPISVFGGFMYGTAKYETYGMPTGLRLAPINTICIPTTTVVGDGIDNDCDGLIDEEMCTVENQNRDDDGDGVRDEDCATPPPIDGGLTAWSSWTTCSISCRDGNTGGTKTRVRTCTNPEPKYDGKQCTGATAETVSCTPTIECPIHGNWGGWGGWGSCSVTCATGTKSRSRSCNNPAPQHNGNDCAGSGSDSASCSPGILCPVDGGYTSWGGWGGCTHTCGGGTNTRTRSCTNPEPAHNGAPCSGSASDSVSCNTQNCPIDGGFSTWTAWTACPVTCGSGRVYRSRTCTNPAPAHGGANCTGYYTSSISCVLPNCPRRNFNPAPAHGGADCNGYYTSSTSCVLPNCPIDGGFTDWTLWSSCTVTCAGGINERTRTCTDPEPQHGGADCVGVPREERTCNTFNCPIDGGFSAWTAWSSCSVTCGYSTQFRSRACDNPYPQYNGAQCSGDDYQTQSCYAGIMCPIDGGLTDWSTWATCTVTCAGGIQNRTRSCTNPTPEHNGAPCTGDTEQSQICNTLNCPIDGGWTLWTDWSGCSSTCGPGLITRDRTCTNPLPQYNGAGCIGSIQEGINCNGSCTVHGSWGDWGAWTSCTKSCNIGRMGRQRLCDNPTPTPDGDPCFGDSFQLDFCNAVDCNNNTLLNGDILEDQYISRCPIGYFTCQGGSITCISNEYVCDCTGDCDDSSDESTGWASCSEFCEDSAPVIGSGLVLLVAALQTLLWFGM